MAKVAAALGTNAIVDIGATNAQQEYTAEEAKVQEYGDTGQGNRLTDAKKSCLIAA